MGNSAPCWPGPIVMIPALGSCVSELWDDDDLTCLMFCCCCVWIPMVLGSIVFIGGLEIFYLLVIALVPSMIAYCNHCVKESRAAERRRELQRQRIAAEKKRKEDADAKRRQFEENEAKLKQSLAKQPYETRMDITAFLYKVCLSELKRKSTDMDPSIRLLKKRWLCFAGDLKAYTVDKLVSETSNSVILNQQGTETVKRILSEMKDGSGGGIGMGIVNSDGYVVPDVEFQDQTPIREFLPKFAEANGRERGCVEGAVKALEANMMTTVSHLKRLLVASDDGIKVVKEEVMGSIPMQAKLWRLLKTGQQSIEMTSLPSMMPTLGPSRTEEVENTLMNDADLNPE
ncbi:hypothetical protein AAMO2058_001411000 [Amorphochlora amoebiformis]